MSVIVQPGGVGVNSSASGGKVSAFNNMSNAPQVVAAANPSRRKITFVNPSDVDIYVAPSVLGNGTALVPSTAAKGGCIPVFIGGTTVIDGECQGAWQAFAASGSGKPFTVIDSNLA